MELAIFCVMLALRSRQLMAGTIFTVSPYGMFASNCSRATVPRHSDIIDLA